MDNPEILRSIEAMADDPLAPDAGEDPKLPFREVERPWRLRLTLLALSLLMMAVIMNVTSISSALPVRLPYLQTS